MLVAKQVADLITLTRALLLVGYGWLGLAQGAAGLPLAALMLVYSWTSDILDGPIARSSRVYYHSWLGDHDLEVDMAVSVGVMVYLLTAGFVSLPVGAAYAAIWVIVFWRWGAARSLGMLFQAPLYAALIWFILRDAFYFGIVLVFWILAAVVVTWPRFPREVIPGFLSDFKVISGRTKRSKSSKS